MTEIIELTPGAMRKSLLNIIQTTGEFVAEADVVQAAFSGGKHVRKWAKKNKLTIESNNGNVTFRTT